MPICDFLGNSRRTATPIILCIPTRDIIDATRESILDLRQGVNGNRARFEKRRKSSKGSRRMDFSISLSDVSAMKKRIE